jgi:hypothetical protein
MREYTQKELNEKIKAFLTSRKVQSFEFHAVKPEKQRVDREKTSIIDWFIPTQLKSQW